MAVQEKKAARVGMKMNLGDLFEHTAGTQAKISVKVSSQLTRTELPMSS